MPFPAMVVRPPPVMMAPPMVSHMGPFIGQPSRVVVQQPVAPAEKPGETFPQNTNFSESVIEHLGAGQFGDVWKAIDTETNEEVAVKVFYQHTPTGKQYLTWNTADEANKEEMRKNIKECELVKEIIRQGQKIYPVGSGRICECKHEYIKQGMANKDNVMYTVWEMCGTSMTKLRKDLGSFSASDRQKAARLLTKQVVEGINLFSMFNPQLIHHDMKADNAVVLGSLEEGYKVKLIDFGCFVRATPQNKYSQSIGDPDYMPPEHSVSSKAFEDPPSSFDIYGTGLIHMELLCPALENTDWSPVRMMTPEMMMFGQKPHLTKDNVVLALKKRCPELFKLKDFNLDLDLISGLTEVIPWKRFLPSTALEQPAMLTAFDQATRMEFAMNDKVEYYSSTEGYWVPCVICKVDKIAGTYDLCREVKFSYELFRTSVDHSRVRAEARIDSKPLDVDESFSLPMVALVFKVGDKVEYHSTTLDRWIRAIVTKVNHFEGGSGSYDLTFVRFEGSKKENVPPERVREMPFSAGTKVKIYGNIEGTVVEYDRDSMTYRVLKAGTTNTFYTSVSRDYVELLE